MHIYWALGGRWGSGAVLPTLNEGEKVIMPGILPTLIVASGLAGFGVFCLATVQMITLPLPGWLDHYGLWFISGIFTIRAIGEFNYVGFFKKIKHTPFALNDTRYYSPLCLILGFLSALLVFIR